MSAYRWFLQTAVLGAAVPASFAGPQADVGLVNMLSGNVSYASEGAAGANASPFMMVREGDRFTLPAGAQLRVVYFHGGRQETWTGPAAFKAGAQQSEAASGQPSDVATLPSSVPQHISQVPELIQIARLGRSGGLAVRGAAKQPRLTEEQRAEVNSAKDTYQKMRGRSQEDDITPELYLYSVLQDYLLYDDMKPVVDEMVKRQPASGDVREMAAWVKSRAQP